MGKIEWVGGLLGIEMKAEFSLTDIVTLFAYRFLSRKRSVTEVELKFRNGCQCCLRCEMLKLKEGCLLTKSPTRSRDSSGRSLKDD